MLDAVRIFFFSAILQTGKWCVDPSQAKSQLHEQKCPTEDRARQWLLRAVITNDQNYEIIFVTHMIKVNVCCNYLAAAVSIT